MGARPNNNSGSKAAQDAAELTSLVGDCGWCDVCRQGPHEPCPNACPQGWASFVGAALRSHTGRGESTGGSTHFRQARERSLDRFFRIGEIFELAAEVAVVGRHVEVAVAGQVEEQGLRI